MKEGFARHSIATNIYSGTIKPADCEYVLSYTALQSWDFAPYLSHAELWLEKDGLQVGYVEYHLIGKGGLSLMKWEGTKTKMDPLLDELLGNVSNAVVGTSVDQKERSGAVEGKPAIQESESKSRTQSNCRHRPHRRL